MTVPERLSRVLIECEELALNEGVRILVVVELDERCGISLPEDGAVARRMLQSASLELAQRSSGLVS